MRIAESGLAMTTDAHRAYRLIKDRIISLELAPGDVIQDIALIEQLHLGRTPIREALKLLEAENLVVSVPRRGVFVSHISITDLQQLCEIRVELEGLSARLAAQRSTDDDLGSVRDCSEQHQLAQTDNVVVRIYADRKMHLALAAATHNRFLDTEIERFYDLSLRLWRLALDHVRAEDVNIASHCDIVSAVVERDADRAESLMREHIRDFQLRIKAAM
jgi:DNA-binding GntR family transcriptional regulator